jgi:hypothetical protein
VRKAQFGIRLGGLLLVLAVAGGLSYLAGGRGSGVVADSTLLFTIIAACGGIASVALTLSGNATAVKQQKDLAEQQATIAKDLRLLAELTESSLEEARAQKPEPTVQFLVPGDAATTEALWQRQSDVREISIKSVLAQEQERAMATLPDQPGAEVAEGLFGSSGLAILRSGIVTSKERNDFKNSVADYLARLEKWLALYGAWREQRALTMRATFQFGNTGRTPAYGARVRLQFPDGFEGVDELPQVSPPPVPPRFTKLGFPDFRIPSLDSLYAVPNLNSIQDVHRPNVSGPSYRKGSCVVEFSIDKLRHRLPEVTDHPAILRIEADGTYTIPWEVHAENMAEPARGTLTLQVATELMKGPPIISMDELVKDLGSGDLSDEEL